MAHELWIDTANGTASMFYVDEEPWHGLGTKLANPATSAEAIKAANLDWEVTKQALYVRQPDGYSLVDDRYAVTRPGTGTEPQA